MPTGSIACHPLGPGINNSPVAEVPSSGAWKAWAMEPVVAGRHGYRWEGKD